MHVHDFLEPDIGWCPPFSIQQELWVLFPEQDKKFAVHPTINLLENKELKGRGNDRKLTRNFTFHRL